MSRGGVTRGGSPYVSRAAVFLAMPAAAMVPCRALVRGRPVRQGAVGLRALLAALPGGRALSVAGAWLPGLPHSEARPAGAAGQT